MKRIASVAAALILFTLSSMSQQVSYSPSVRADYPVQSFTADGVGPMPASNHVLKLTYWQMTPQQFNWECWRDYGSFINHYMFHRFTLPGNTAFLDSVAIWVTSINQGSLLIRVREDTLIHFNGASFHFPKSLNTPAIDSVIVPGSSLKMNNFTIVKLNGKAVPKEFHISVEYTISSGTPNVFTMIGDAHQKAARSTQNSRIVMLNQDKSSGALTMTILDSLLVDQNQNRVYSTLRMEAYVDTTAFSPVPSITSVPKTKAWATFEYTYDVHASGSPRPTYSLLQKPAAMTIDATNGIIRWTPTRSDMGDHQVRVRAENPNGSDEQLFTVTVADTLSPKITSYPRKRAIVGEPYFYQVTAVGGPEPNFSIVQGATGMTIEPATGILRMTPTAGQIGLVLVSVAASNPLGFDAQNFPLIIDAAQSAPKIESVPKATGTAGIPYRYVCDFTGNPQPTWTLTKAPTGLVIGNISGIVTWDSPVEGSHEVTIRAENRAGFDTQTYTLVINPPTSGPKFTSTPITVATADQEYSYTAVATGAPAPRYLFGVSSIGMVLDSLSGVLRWTPTRLQRGVHPVTILARNPAGTVEQNYSIYVRAIPKIISTQVFTAKVGTPYSYKLEVEAEPSATFSLKESPAGMSVNTNNGQISWTPTAGQVGQHNVRAEATNEVGSDEQIWTVDVSPQTSIGAISENGFTLEAPYPNPVRLSERFIVDLELPMATTMRLEIRNVLGQVVAELANRRMEAGTHAITYDVHENRLPSGVYQIVMVTPIATLARTVTVVR